MSERDDLRKARELINQGKRPAARGLILDLEPRIKEPKLRLELIDLAVNALNSVKDNAKKVVLSIEAAGIARKFGREDLEAHFLAKSADFSMIQVSLWHYRRSILTLAPRWFQFATETEKTEYESLNTLVDALEKDIDTRLSRAITQAEHSGAKKVYASVLMSKGSTESARYLRFKMDHMRGYRARLWTAFPCLHSTLFEYLLFVWNGDSAKLNVYVQSFKNSFVRAAGLAEEINDPIGGYAYYNLAIHLKSAYRFSEAKRYLTKARAIASAYGEAALMPLIEMLEKAIAAKNRDIPDYLSGEAREFQ